MTREELVLTDALLAVGIGLTVFQLQAVEAVRLANAGTRGFDRLLEALQCPTVDKAHSRALAWHRAQVVAELRSPDQRDPFGFNSIARAIGLR